MIDVNEDNFLKKTPRISPGFFRRYGLGPARRCWKLGLVGRGDEAQPTIISDAPYAGRRSGHVPTRFP